MTRILSVVLVVYLLAYIGFRNANSQVWDQDGQTYVIFPTELIGLYYAFRPLSWLDSLTTGMRFHIGEHQER